MFDLNNALTRRETVISDKNRLSWYFSDTPTATSRIGFRGTTVAITDTVTVQTLRFGSYYADRTTYEIVTATCRVQFGERGSFCRTQGLYISYNNTIWNINQFFPFPLSYTKHSKLNKFIMKSRKCFLFQYQMKAKNRSRSSSSLTASRIHPPPLVSAASDPALNLNNNVLLAQLLTNSMYFKKRNLCTAFLYIL